MSMHRDANEAARSGRRPYPQAEPTPGRGPAGRPPRTARSRAGAGAASRWAGIRALVEAIPEPVLVTLDSQLALTNPAADQLFAEQPVVDRSDLISRFEPVALDRPEALPAGTRPDGSSETLIVRQRSRPNRWFALRTVPLTGGDDDAPEPSATGPADGEPLAFLLRDVTDTHDLQPLREAFLGLVSHELRTPITTIYAGSSVLAREPGLSAPATRTLAHDVSVEAARLYDVVEDLLALGRIERVVLDPLPGADLARAGGRCRPARPGRPPSGRAGPAARSLGARPRDRRRGVPRPRPAQPRARAGPPPGPASAARDRGVRAARRGHG